MAICFLYFLFFVCFYSFTTSRRWKEEKKKLLPFNCSFVNRLKRENAHYSIIAGLETMDFLSTDTKEIRGRRKVEEKNVQGLSNYDSTIEMKNVAQNQIGETGRTTGIE